MKHCIAALPLFGISGIALAVVLVLPALLLPQTSHAGTSLTVIVTNIPSGWGTANGDSISIIGTFNGWSLGSSATIADHSLRYDLSSVNLSALGSDWADRPAGANIGFRFVASSDIANTLILADFFANDGNFRLALREGTTNTVEINAGPIRTLVDQSSAVRVNGVREREVVAIDRDRFAFPGGLWKALVMSYDDGHDQDRGLIPIFNRYGIKGTFHLCSEWFDKSTFVSSEDVRTIYAPHEVSVHSVNHPTLSDLDDESIRWQVGHCRWAISQLTGYNPNSMSYPMGGYNNNVFTQIAGQGITCSRTVKPTFSLDYLPPNPLKWHPTCHHANASAFADAFIDRSQEQMALLFIWGHSYELTNTYADNSWAYMSSLCQKLGHRGDTWYAGMEEVRAYLAAIQDLAYPSPNVIRNPSGTLAVWAKPGNTLLKIAPGKTITWPSGFSSVAPEITSTNATLSISYATGSNALSRAASIYAHIGHDGWQETRDVLLSPGENGVFTAAYAPPAGCKTVEWAFFDGGQIWDDHGGGDWRFSIRNPQAAEPAALDVETRSPVILAKSPSDQNAVGERVDLPESGTAISPSSQGGFGGFGTLQVHCDATNLYLEGTGLDTGGNNNAVLLFLQIDTLPHPATTLWDFTGTPYGLDFLHNAVFDPGVNVAILLGDEYGDGTFLHFNLESGSDLGQGVFYTDTSVKRFLPVPGVRLSQFDGVSNAPTLSVDDDANRQTDRWQLSIPWSSLNAPLGAASVGSLHLYGLIASDGTSGNDRYLSGNFLGRGISGDRDGSNFGFHVATLSGQRIGLPGADSDLDGMPDLWERRHGLDGATANDANADADADGFSNHREYIADTRPEDRDSHFEVKAILPGPPFELRASMSSNRVYALYASSNLATGTWTLISPPRPGTGDNDSMSNSNSAGGQFYRLQVRLP